MSVMFLPLRLIPAPVQAVVLSSVLELFFARDRSLRPLLDDLSGKVFHIHVADTGGNFWLGFARGKPWVHPSHSGHTDVRIEASTAGFARLCFAKEDPDELVFQRVLKLSGDSESMLRFKKLLQAADIDYERELRGAFGDWFGARVAQAAQSLLAAEAKFAARSSERIGAMLRDIELPGATRLEEWQAGVEGVAHKIDRLRGRIERIERQSGARGEE